MTASTGTSDIRIPVPQPPAVQTMSATPEVVAQYFTVSRDLQRSKHASWVKIIGGSVASWIILASTLWALGELGVIENTAILAVCVIVSGVVSFAIGWAWGRPDFLGAQDALGVLPDLKTRLWREAEIALNQLTGLGLDLDGDGSISTMEGDFPVNTYTDRDNGNGVRVDTHRLVLKQPFPPHLRLSPAQVMEFIKTGMAKGFVRDRAWCVPGSPNIVLLPGTPDEIEITRTVYDQITAALKALGVIGVTNRQEGTKMMVNLGQAREIIMGLVDIKRETTYQ